MNVAILCLKKDFTNKSGEGPARYVYNLYSALNDLNFDHKLFLINTHRIYGNGRSFTGNMLSFVTNTFLKDFSKFDIIHILYFNLLFSPLKLNSKIITLVYDSREIMPIGNDNYSGIYKRIVNFAGRRALRSDYIITISTQSKEELVTLGFPKKNIFVASPGVDKRFLMPLKHKIKSKTFNVGYLGSFQANKNVKFAIDAFKFIESNKIKFMAYGKKDNQ
ncbi:MAG: glycosyltransferase, partial [Candidatus Micrarchaeaceae archaeon]